MNVLADNSTTRALYGIHPIDLRQLDERLDQTIFKVGFGDLASKIQLEKRRHLEFSQSISWLQHLDSWPADGHPFTIPQIPESRFGERIFNHLHLHMMIVYLETGICGPRLGIYCAFAYICTSQRMDDWERTQTFDRLVLGTHRHLYANARQRMYNARGIIQQIPPRRHVRFRYLGRRCGEEYSIWDQG